MSAIRTGDEPDASRAVVVAPVINLMMLNSSLVVYTQLFLLKMLYAVSSKTNTPIGS